MNQPVQTTSLPTDVRRSSDTPSSERSVVSRAQIDIALAAANIVSSYVSKNAMTFASVPKMIAEVHATILTLIKNSEPIDYAEPTDAAQSVTIQALVQHAALAADAPPQRTVIAQPKIINPAALTVADSPVKSPVDGAQLKSENAYKAAFVMSEPAKTPVIPIELSIYTDRIYCLECGKVFATLNRHLKMTHHIGELEYRATYGLSPSYPMSCQAFIESRSELIKGGKFRPSTKEEIAEKRRRVQSLENTDSAGASANPRAPVAPKAAGLERSR